MFDEPAEKGLESILKLLREYLPLIAMKPLEDSIRTYGDLRATGAVIKYLSNKASQGDENAG